MADHGIRCPYCNKKLGDYLEGLYINKCCPRCKKEVIIDRRKPVVVS